MNAKSAFGSVGFTGMVDEHASMIFIYLITCLLFIDTYGSTIYMLYNYMGHSPNHLTVYSLVTPNSNTEVWPSLALLSNPTPWQVSIHFRTIAARTPPMLVQIQLYKSPLSSVT